MATTKNNRANPFTGAVNWAAITNESHTVELTECGLYGFRLTEYPASGSVSITDLGTGEGNTIEVLYSGTPQARQCRVDATNKTGFCWFHADDNGIVVSCDYSGGGYVGSEENIDDIATAAILPTGMIVEYTDTSAPTGWLLCNGDEIGNVGSGATHESATYETLYNIVKAGWGNTGAEVFGDGDTVVLPDLRGMFLRGTGTHGTLTMANSNAFAGPAIGASENDQVQGHYHNFSSTASVPYYNGTVAGVGGSGNIGNVGAATFAVQSMSNDGTYGVPRSGDETRPVAYGINYIIKI